MNRLTPPEPKRVCEECHQAIKLHDKYVVEQYEASGKTLTAYSHRNCERPESYSVPNERSVK